MKEYYSENTAYKKMLDEIPYIFYEKYIIYIKKYLSKDDSFLDIGCGIGTVANHLISRGYKKCFGCDVSELFIEEAKSKSFSSNFYLCEDEKLPFDSEKFSVCGSFTTLEHVENPEKFIQEMIRVIKKGGIGIIVSPNFLSATFPVGHEENNSLFKKTKNFFIIIKKIFLPFEGFNKMEIIERVYADFLPDDDAIVKTNVVDIIKFLEKKNLEIIKISGFTRKHSSLIEFISSMPFFRLILPSCFVIFRKKND